jgi:hypothetical protein
MIEDMKVYLEDHIKLFPSDFDGTSIGQQLREAVVPVMLYADVRDRLWVPLREERARRSSIFMAVSNFQYAMTTAADELRTELVK